MVHKCLPVFCPFWEACPYTTSPYLLVTNFPVMFLPSPWAFLLTPGHSPQMSIQPQVWPLLFLCKVHDLVCCFQFSLGGFPIARFFGDVPERPALLQLPTFRHCLPVVQNHESVNLTCLLTLCQLIIESSLGGCWSRLGKKAMSRSGDHGQGSHVTLLCLQGLPGPVLNDVTSVCWWVLLCMLSSMVWWVRQQPAQVHMVTWYPWLSIQSLLGPTSKSEAVYQKESSCP